MRSSKGVLLVGLVLVLSVWVGLRVLHDPAVGSADSRSGAEAVNSRGKGPIAGFNRKSGPKTTVSASDAAVSASDAGLAVRNAVQREAGAKVIAGVSGAGGASVLVSGQIRDFRTRRPILEARVGAPGLADSVKTDAEGRYQLQLPGGPNRLLLQASARNYQLLRTTLIVAQESTEIDAVDFELHPAPRIQGVVVDERTGRPIAGAKLLYAGSAVSASAESDAEGRFVLFGLLANGGLDVQAEGYARFWRSVGIPVQQDEVELQIALRPASAVEGRILDPMGSALEGARVQVRPLDRGEPGREVRTDGQGRYRFEALEGGKTYRILVTHPGFLCHLDAPFWLDGGAAIQRPDMRLEGAGALAGVVVVGSGRKAPGFKVVVQNQERPRGKTSTIAEALAGAQELGSAPFSQAELIGRFFQERVEGVTAEDGSFSFPTLVPGVYRVTVPQGLGVLASQPDVQIRAGETVRGLELSVGEVLYISGHVLDRQGSPLQGVWVDAVAPDHAEPDPALRFTSLLKTESFRSALTRNDGSYRLGPLEPAGYRIRIQFAGREQQQVAQASTESLDFVLTGPELRGQVVDASTGQPVHQFSLATNSSREAPDVSRARSFYSVDGTFELLSPVSSQLSVQVWAPGYLSSTIGPLEFVSGQDEKRVRLELRKAPVLSGVLSTEAGEPIAGATVCLLEGDAGYSKLLGLDLACSPHYFTDRKGVFRLEGVMTGWVKLQAGHPDYAPVTVGISFEETESPETLHIRLHRGYTVEGRIYGAPAEALEAGLLVEVAEGGMASVRSDGSFQIRRLPSGRHLFKVHSTLDWDPALAEISMEVQEDLQGLNWTIPP